MSSIIRLKENNTIQEMFELLQHTRYTGLDKTEILRALLAEKTWDVKNQIALGQQKPVKLPPMIREKALKAYQSHTAGKSKTVKVSEIEDFLHKAAQ